MKKNLTLEDYLKGFREKNRAILARAITLIESSHPEHQQLARQLLGELLPQTGKSMRLGISGTPGVGKSSFIEAFGKRLTAQAKTLAVLAVDPTSQVSGGSILGDKTRMNELALDPLAYIRPSASGETLGGVARRTRESILLCEAFGFDYVLVETVGVGQSETTVAQMVDIFIMLLQPGAGDDLQGIKRGILELVDMVVVTKDDGDNSLFIEKAKGDYQRALQILRHDSIIPPVLSCSALTKKGLDEIQLALEKYFTQHSQLISERRNHQGLSWMWQLINDGLKDCFRQKISPHELSLAEQKVLSHQSTPVEVASELLERFANFLCSTK
jgi:LAO/AO transport system kinase